MKRSSLLVLGLLLLSACVFDPVFDTSNWNAYQRSSAAVRAKLRNDDLRRLDIALRYLWAESAPSLEPGGQQYSTVAARTNSTNPAVILARLGPRINGKSAAAVIQNLIIRLDTEIAEVGARLRNSDPVLAAVEVTSPSYFWRRSGRLEQPVIEFSSYNAGTIPISRVYYTAMLTSPNRSIPWVKQSFIQNFEGGLEPRERRKLTLEPTYGAWNDKQLKDLPDAEFKIVVTNFEDANGEKITAVDGDGLEAKRRVRASLQ